MASGRPEVPERRTVVPGQQRIASHLVAERATDPCLGGVADVVEVEEQERAALAGLERCLGPAQPVGAESVEVDALFVVDPHVARSRQRTHRGAHDLSPPPRPSLPPRPSSTTMFSGLSSNPELAACRSSRIEKSSVTRPLLTLACTSCAVIAATGMGTSSSRAAASPRSKSLRSRIGVNVGVKSRLTRAGVL